MDDNARKQFNIIYTGLLTGTYEKSTGVGLLQMCRLVSPDTDKMSIRLLEQVLSRNRGKLSDMTKLDIAEEIIGTKGEIAAGIAFLAFVKGDRDTSRKLRDTAAELCSEALTENPRNKARAEALTKLCDDFALKEKELIRMKVTGDIMDKLGFFSGKEGS